MSKRIKEMVAAELRQRIGDCRDLLVVDYSGLDGLTENTLRLKLLKQNIRMLGVKNSLARKVLGELGMTGLDAALSGPSTLVFGGPDIVALSKEISKWAKDLEKLQIKGGLIDGAPLTPADVESLSKSPSREELLSKIVSLALGPGARLAAALLGAGGTIAGQIKTLADKEEEASPAAAS